MSIHRVTRIAYQKQLAAGNYRLSKEVQQRLKIIDWYRLKSMCGIGQYTRRPVVHVSSNCSSAAGKTALQKIRQRFIGTLQTECPDYHCEPMNVHELQESIDEWIFKYENQRPHEGLDFLTPKQFEAMFYTQKNSLVSYFQ